MSFVAFVLFASFVDKKRTPVSANVQPGGEATELSIDRWQAVDGVA